MKQYQEKDALKIIREVIQKKMDVIGWFAFNNFSSKARLKIVEVSEYENKLIFGFTKSKNENIFQVISGFSKINIFVPHVSLLFCSRLQSMDIEKGIIQTEFPELSIFYDRRESARIELEFPVWSYITIGSTKYSKKVSDLSLGGMSIVFSKSERFNLKEGNKLKGVILSFGKNNMEFEVKLTQSLKLQPFLLSSCPYGGLRASFQFIDLDKDKLEFLNMILLSHVGMVKKLS